ncbi:MAG TPA: hypothetical protein ENJ28_03020 [Gammaproteobacteria bacterium]|nr:hypothetical protein [Gammaproteobacteria bacterium]
MLNLGLVLERPYESKYNAYRRFLIANGKKSLKDIRDELKKKFESSYTRHFSLTQKMSTFQMFQLLDHHAKCGTLELDTRHMTNSIPSTIYNCPECARSCFHSNLYQLPWLRLCPIHHQPLTAVCPTCDNLWPKLGEMKTRRCKTCGTKYRWDELKVANTFLQEDLNTKKLECINSIIKDYETLTLGTLINLYVPDNILNKHHSIHSGDTALPSVMATINPSLVSTFYRFGIKHRRLQHLSFPARLKPVTQFIDINYHYYDDHLNAERAKDIRKEIENIIKNEINERFRITDLTFPEGFYFGEKRYLCDITYLPILAFGIWKNLVEGKGLICSQAFKHHELRVPCLLETLIFDEKNLFEIQYSRKPHVEYSAPIEIQKIVYKYDLWKTFIYTLQYLDAIRYLNNKNDYSWHGLQQVLDDTLGSTCLNRPDFSFMLIYGKYIAFFYSELCNSFSLRYFTTLK